MALRDQGFEIEIYYGSSLEGIGQGLRVRALSDHNCVQFGVKHSFDRWANSVDFKIDRIPKTIEDANVIIEAAINLCKSGSFDPDMGAGTDLGPHVRAIKRKKPNKSYRMKRKPGRARGRGDR